LNRPIADVETPRCFSSRGSAAFSVECAVDISAVRSRVLTTDLVAGARLIASETNGSVYCQGQQTGALALFEFGE
jgi:hypothetical protein